MAKTFADAGIDAPAGLRGQVRILCPKCSSSRKKSHDRCLSVNIDQGVWNCWYCGWHGALESNSKAPQPSRKPKALHRVQQVWDSAGPMAYLGPPTLYLRHRSIAWPFWSEHLRDLRYHPALLCPYRNSDAELVGLQRLYLTLFVTKADVPIPKRTLSVHPGALRGAAIQLYIPTDELAVAEGLETALAARKLSGLPVWACGSASMLARVEIPISVKVVTIVADHDAPGLKAARTLAKRMLAQRRQIRIATPPYPRQDWADVALEGMRNGK